MIEIWKNKNAKNFIIFLFTLPDVDYLIKHTYAYWHTQLGGWLHELNLATTLENGFESTATFNKLHLQLSPETSIQITHMHMHHLPTHN